MTDHPLHVIVTDGVATVGGPNPSGRQRTLTGEVEPYYTMISDCHALQK